MVVKVKADKIILTWSWGGRLELTSSGARHFVQLLLDAIAEAEKGLQVEKQL